MLAHDAKHTQVSLNNSRSIEEVLWMDRILHQLAGGSPNTHRALSILTGAGVCPSSVLGAIGGARTGTKLGDLANWTGAWGWVRFYWS